MLNKTIRKSALDDGIAHVHESGILIALNYDAVMLEFVLKIK